MIPVEPSDPRPARVALPPGPLAYADEGEGPALVAVHGLPGSHRDFRYLAAALAGLRFIRPDLPGFGASPAATEPDTSVAARARVVIALLAALDIEQAVVLGHSMGGAVALEVARLAPARVAGLALLASVGLRPRRLWRRSFLRSSSLALRVPGIGRLLLPVVRSGFARAGFPRGLTDEAIVRTVHGAAWTSFARNAENLAALRLPTLVAWAEDDPLVEPEVSEELAARAPVGPRLPFVDGGHNIQKTRAVEIGRALVEMTAAARAGQAPESELLAAGGRDP